MRVAASVACVALAEAESVAESGVDRVAVRVEPEVVRPVLDVGPGEEGKAAPFGDRGDGPSWQLLPGGAATAARVGGAGGSRRGFAVRGTVGSRAATVMSSVCGRASRRHFSEDASRPPGVLQ